MDEIRSNPLLFRTLFLYAMVTKVKEGQWSGHFEKILFKLIYLSSLLERRLMQQRKYVNQSYEQVKDQRP